MIMSKTKFFKWGVINNFLDIFTPCPSTYFFEGLFITFVCVVVRDDLCLYSSILHISHVGRRNWRRKHFSHNLQVSTRKFSKKFAEWVGQANSTMHRTLTNQRFGRGRRQRPDFAPDLFLSFSFVRQQCKTCPYSRRWSTQVRSKSQQLV